jgi:predicted nucleic acid-binding protein
MILVDTNVVSEIMKVAPSYTWRSSLCVSNWQ